MEDVKRKEGRGGRDGRVRGEVLREGRGCGERCLWCLEMVWWGGRQRVLRLKPGRMSTKPNVLPSLRSKVSEVPRLYLRGL